MEMSMWIFDQQQAPPVANPTTKGKTVKAQQAGMGQGNFNATFNKALEETAHQEKTDFAQSDTDKVPAEGTGPAEQLAAGISAMIQPVGELLAADALLPAVREATAKGTMLNPLPDTVLNTENGVMDHKEMPVSVRPAEMVSPRAAAIDFSDIPIGQKSAPEGVSTLEASSDLPAQGEIARPTAGLPAEEQHAPALNPHKVDMPVDAASKAEQPTDPGHPAAGMRQGSKPALPEAGTQLSTELSTELSTQLSTQPAPVTADVTEEKIPAMPLKAEQPGEKKEDAAKPVLTAVAIPAPETGGQNATANGSHTDTSENLAPMTPMAAVQTAKAETAHSPFPAVEAPPPVKEQVMQEIVQRARFMATGTQQEIQIQLKPEHLGLLNVQIAVDNGALTAKFQTENPQVKQALEASFNQLKQDLQVQGFKVQHVGVSLAQQGMSFSEFSRRAPHFNLIKSKRIGKVDIDQAEQFTDRRALMENYGGLHSGGVDYKI